MRKTWARGGGGDLSRDPWYVVLARAFVYDGRKARILKEHERNETRPVEVENDRLADRANDTEAIYG